MAHSSDVCAASLRITEVFLSLQGESTRSGLPTVFVRLTGCPLRCGYCDTAYAFEGGHRRTVSELITEVAAFGVPYVTVTGGEPLAQSAALALLTALCNAGFDVSLETSGALPVDAVDTRVVKILDIKTPASGECHRNLWDNLDGCTPRDQLKFVICDRNDYEWARLQCETRNLFERVSDVLFSPVTPGLDPAELAEWMLRDRIRGRLQIQLHKLLWGGEAGR